MGLAATAVVLVVYAFGGLDWLELKTLDLRFLYANSIPERDDLVCVDIDDSAIDVVGRWPWPRDVQAGLISILGELGVKSLLVDITLGEAEPVRTIVPPQADIVSDPLELLEHDPGAVTVALPDDELRAAIEQVPAVYLATDYSTGRVWKDFLGSDGLARVLAALEAGQESLAAQRAAEIKPPAERKDGPPWNPWLWARLVAALTADPTLDNAALAAELDVPPKVLAPVVDACRDAGFRRRVLKWLDVEPSRWAAKPRDLYWQLNTDLIPQAPRYDETLAVALRDVLSYEATTRSAGLPVERLGDLAPHVDSISPVYFEHARAARRCAFVVFTPDRDGVMRRTRLLVQHGGRVLPQLALAVALDALGLGPEKLEARRGDLVLHRRDGEPLVIQLDGDGRVIVPWVAQGDWTRQFGEHVPIATVWQVWDRRQKILVNDRRLLELLETQLNAGRLAEHAQYREDLQTRLRVEDQLREANHAGRQEDIRRLRELTGQCDQLVAEGEGKLRSAVADELARTEAVRAGPVMARSCEPEQVDNAGQEYVAALHDIRRALVANGEFEVEIRDILHRIGPRIEGRIGLIGYTATSLADMTAIPTHERAPGVMAHANLLNGLLSGRMVRWAPAWMNALLVVVLGCLVTAMSVRYGPRTAAGLALLVIGYVGVAGWLAFYLWTYWIALTPALLGLALSYISVLAYRYLFLERERRQLTTVLGQYTSATLARRMSEDAELCRRAETREVTAIFTDLANFTTISERIGAERTQHVLNVSLGRFSDVMLRYEGMINKFIGDGIFAFWNPVIYPQPDHAVRACETAIDLMAGLRELVEQQRQAGGDEVFGELILRIGVATGNAVVGPCGSEQKYDYTCIGDSVNVASRLESANKFYGTCTLISGATYEQTGSRFAVRSLGGVQVKGKTQGVPIYELLGRAGDVSDDALRYAEGFGDAVAAFQRREWTRSCDLFEAGLRACPDDLAARQYIEAARGYLVTPPGDGWNGALELTEK